MAVEKQQPLLDESFAEDALNYLKEKNTEKLINIVKDLNLSDDLQTRRQQKFAEYCIHDILSILSSNKETFAFKSLLWTILSSISSIAFVRRVLWKTESILPALSESLQSSVTSSNKKIQKSCTNIVSTTLIGAPTSYFQQVAELNIIKLMLEIINSEEFAEETFKSIICCFGQLCDGTDLCKGQLIELNVAEAVFNMGDKHAIEDEDFSELAALTYDDLVVLKIDGSIGRKKFLRSQLDDIVFCSNIMCLKAQKGAKFKKCSLCKITFYCSKDCQVEHWKLTHHRTCVGKK